MNEAKPQPTLLVFTLGAAAESRRRRLLPGLLRGEEQAFRGACLEAALAAGRQAGCRLEVSCPVTLETPADVTLSPQAGEHFGARLAGAMDSCLARSRSPVAPVVVVGTDVPGLAAGHVRQALAALAVDPDGVVLGPSPDGGVYLVAAARPIAGLATDVRWCSGATLSTLREALEAAGRPVTLLTPLADLDRPRDLERWLKASRRVLRAAPLAAWAARLRDVLEGLKKLLPRLAPTFTPAPEPVVVPVRGPPRRPHSRPPRRPVRAY
jgi:glycosyltransferase A (GT-A) superfamily protein (DUF2064 family)